MKQIEHRTIVLSKNRDKIFDALSNCDTFKQLFAEKVENWETHENQCSFTAPTVGNIVIEIIPEPQENMVRYRSVKAPVNFEIQFGLSELSPSSTEMAVSIYTDANSMVLMVLKNPLRHVMERIEEQSKIIADKFIA